MNNDLDLAAQDMFKQKNQCRELLNLIQLTKDHISSEPMDSLVAEVAGLITGHLVLPKRIKTRPKSGVGITSERTLDIVTAFMEENSIGRLVSSSEIRERLIEWCSYYGIVPPGRTSTGFALRQLGWIPRRGSGGRRMWAAS
ncbi:hypothetical protein L2W58_08215 [Dethiosulfovibrio sp. F2B]|uniref:hypothetical protein n=1 Tax=Dethiosulfovibrio faecalis TaxID=2720018 RepID=UPI001F41CC9B|nr:hypothetical protein [Dethiosulfovibrio faecalis]MCF4151786.1 hypothetical protein [Dethiosulfovibrio faecalis]